MVFENEMDRIANERRQDVALRWGVHPESRVAVHLCKLSSFSAICLLATLRPPRVCVRKRGGGEEEEGEERENLDEPRIENRIHHEIKPQ